MTEILKKKEPIDEPIVIWVCQDCGCEEVEQKSWIKVNTGEYAGDCGGDNDDNWCPNCESHTPIIPQEDFIEEEE